MENRRKNGGLTPEQVEQIKAAVLASIYEEIGRSIVSKSLWILGTLVALGLTYLGLTGKIK
jgi:hypothetical protein